VVTRETPYRVEVATGETIRRGDVVSLGGRSHPVADVAAMPGGARRVDLGGGVILVLRPGARLVVARPCPHRRLW
jgi:hypothetical protein